MKKCRLLAFVLPLLFCACNEHKEDPSDERGSLQIASTVVGVEMSRTRAEADVNQFTLILENESNPEVYITGLFSDFPDGTINDIPVGNYVVTLTSHPEGFTPAFDDPWYEGVRRNISVVSGRTNMVAVECIQANAGVSFVFDPSLEAVGLGNIVPEMTQGGTTLYFEGDNRERKAYFLSEPVELKIKNGNEYLMIGGKLSQTLDLSKEELWETTLKASQITSNMGIIASVKVIKDPTNFVEFELGQNEPITVTGLHIGAYTASFLAKGTNIEAVKFGLFETAAVESRLELGLPLESILDDDRFDLAEAYLRQLNTAEGLEMGFVLTKPEERYSLLLKSTRQGVICTQRCDFVSSEGIAPDAVQDPDGPITPGFYRMVNYETEIDGTPLEPYDCDIRILKANQKNLYIVSYLFMFDGFDLVADYNPKTEKLTFTGKDIKEYDVFNDITLIYGKQYAGIFLSDGTSMVDKLEFDVKDRKLEKSTVQMQLRLFDALSFKDLGCMEMSPVNSPFTYVGTTNPYEDTEANPVHNRMFRYPSHNASTRSGVTRANGKLVLHSSVFKL